jgi:hypothetical protein
MASKEPRTLCAVAGCPNRVKSTPWSKHCERHHARARQYGHPTVKVPRHLEYRRYRDPVAKTLAKYGRSNAVQKALVVADDLLTYRPQMDYKNHLQLAEHMALLREGGVTAREILQNVCETAAMRMLGRRLEEERAFDYALARRVLMLRPRGTWRPGGPLLRYAGNLIREELGVFPYGLLAKLEEDDQARAQAKEEFRTGWAVPE